MRISFFGSSLVSSYWNGAATYYRGILRALSQCGFEITFYEPDAYDRQKHRDMPDPEWARVVVYPATWEGVEGAMREARNADVLIKASGVGAFDAWLEEAVLEDRRSGATVCFWDVDAPATLDRLHADSNDPFHRLIPEYDIIFTYGGGPPVVAGYTQFGAARCIPIYNGLDPDIHHPVQPAPRFAADLAFMGNRLPDRESRVRQFFFTAAEALPGRHFLLGGNGWNQDEVPRNVRCHGHIYTHEHNAFNCTPLAVLNINRLSMARYGFSPATRVFEAAGAGACMITDAWEGVERFFEPGEEWLVAEDGEEVAALLADLTPARARQMGEAARRRARSEHTYTQRAALVDEALRAGVCA